MRVIETFVTSVPREKIPTDANNFTQDTDTGELWGFNLSPIMHDDGYWYSKGTKAEEHELVVKPVSTDAAETVVTREELMRAYDLVEQGYTLWFGGECPVERGTLVDHFCDNGHEGKETPAKLVRWRGSVVIAYRLSRSVGKDVAVSMPCVSGPTLKFYEPLTDKLKTRLEVLDKMTGGFWPGEGDEQFLITEDGKQLFRFEPEKVITRAQWDNYISRKIRVGDKARTPNSDAVVEVLFIGESTSFIRDDHGFEGAVLTSLLTRIPQ